MSTDHTGRQEPTQEYSHLKPVAWAILVMGISLAIIILLWIFVGHIGSSYSPRILINQQRSLRRQYGLSPRPVITDPKLLETPPSLRPSYIRNCIPISYC
jgi:hypothetical protein